MAGKNLEYALAKRKQAQQIMKDLDIPVWITFTFDNEAEKAHLPLIGAPFGASPKAYVLTHDHAVAFVHDIEADIQQKYGFETINVGRKKIIPSMAKSLESVIGGQGIAPIALNFSYRFGKIDTLGYGTFIKFSKELNNVNYFPQDYKEQKFISADELIFNVASTKLPHEIALLEKATKITNDALIESFEYIKTGMTEQNVANIVHEIADKKIADDNRIDYSWPKENNPTVLTGEGIAESPHMKPSERIIESGATVYIDFGLSFEGYRGDLQHFGYVLKKKETKAPKHVQKMFHTLVNSIKAGMSAAKPETLGWEVDKASRDVIQKAGYPSYKHSTGHQLGAGGVHAPGVSLGPKFEDYTNKKTSKADINEYSHLPLKENYVMTIEPRIQITNGASIEVDGIITSKGFELFAPIQQNIHLIE